jgi:Flp pilus assembly protein TadG
VRPIDCRGNLTIEFAILVPLFLLLAIGVFDIGMVMTQRLELEFATEGGARCLATYNNPNPNPCSTPDATNAFAASLLPAAFGVSASNFVATKTATTGCVTSSFTYQPVILPSAITLGTSACWPL